MAGPLIQVADLETRIGRTLTTEESNQATALIKDASALVREIAGTDFVNDAGEIVTPPAIVPVVVSMVRRATVNPYGRSSEDIGDASWQGQGTIYATRRERGIIRKAAGTLGVGSLGLEGYLPISPEFRGIGSGLLGEE